MKNFGICIYLVVSLFITSQSIWAAPNAKPPDIQHDARLDQVVSVTVAYDSLEEFCARLVQMTGIPMTVDAAIRDNKVVVRVNQQPLREVMRQIALLFDFDWQQSKQKPTKYYLAQSKTRAELGPRLRRRYDKEFNQRFLEMFRHSFQAANANKDELRAMAQHDPEAVAIALLNPVVSAALSSLDEAELQKFLTGTEVHVPLKALPEKTQALLKKSLLQDSPSGGIPFREEDWRWDQAFLRLRQTYRQFPWTIDASVQAPRASDGQIEHLNTPLIYYSTQAPWRSLERMAASSNQPPQSDLPGQLMLQAAQFLRDECGLNLARKSRTAPLDAMPAWMQPARRQNPPAPSGKSLPLTPLKNAIDQPEIQQLLSIADTLNINIIADCYWTRVINSLLRPSNTVYLFSRDATGTPTRNSAVDANAAYTIDQVCKGRSWGWAQDGNFFRLRNLYWFVDDVEEVPASVLTEWLRRTDEETHVTIDDYLYLVDHLTEAQARALGRTTYRGHYYRETGNPENSRDEKFRQLRRALSVAGFSAYPAIKLYSRLSPELRKRAETEGLSIKHDLPKELRALAYRIAEVQNRVDNHGFRGNPTEVHAQANKAFLWAGWTALFDDEEGDIKSHQPRQALAIQLRNSGRPDWNNSIWDGDILYSCSLFHITSEDAPKLTELPSTSKRPPAYARMELAPKTTLYLQFTGSEMRIAATPQLLASAKPLAAIVATESSTTFPPVNFSTPEASSADYVKLSGNFLLMHSPSTSAKTATTATLYGSYTVSRKDSAGAIWTFAGGGKTPTGPNIQDVPFIYSLERAPLRLEFVTQIEQRKIRVALRFAGGGLGTPDLRKDGQELNAQVRILDSKCNIIASDSGPIATKFGFG